MIHHVRTGFADILLVCPCLLVHRHAIVRDALSLLVCSRHGLRETELLELLAPDGKTQLPPVVWTRYATKLNCTAQSNLPFPNAP